MRSRNYSSSGNKSAFQIICISTSSEFPLHFFQITKTSEKKLAKKLTACGAKHLNQTCGLHHTAQIQ